MTSYVVLGVVAFLLLFEKERQLYLLYILIGAVAGGETGLAAGLAFWVLFRYVRFPLKVFGRDL